MITSIALAAVISTSTCDWNAPGADRFTGDAEQAIDDYKDIPPDVRAVLKSRVAKQRYDEIVPIARDSIGGGHYESTITDMHFGANKVCGTVVRSKWQPGQQALGMVYCKGEYCIIIPTVCGNVARIRKTRVETAIPFPNSGRGLKLQPVLPAGLSAEATAPVQSVLPLTILLPSQPQTIVERIDNEVKKVHDVPEPASIFLVLLGLLGIGINRSRI
jgi:hypothetical protein